MFSCFGSIFFLELFLAFAVALQLFSELTAKEATAGAAAMVTIEAETVKEEGYVAQVNDSAIIYTCSVEFPQG